MQEAFWVFDALLFDFGLKELFTVGMPMLKRCYAYLRHYTE